jgi:hypothetical protein
VSDRGQTFVVEIKPRGAGYASKPGDRRRSGRAEAGGGLVPVQVEFVERSNQIEARLGVVTVAAVTHDTTSKGYFWAVYLPGFSAVPRSARDSDAAKRAILHKVREWCEAAKLITARRA